MDWLEDEWIDWQKIIDYICKESEIMEEIDMLKGNEQSPDALSWFLRCLRTAAKAEFRKDQILSRCSETFTRLYRDSIPKFIGFHVSEQSWEWMFREHKPHKPEAKKARLRTVYSDEGVLLCLALLTDLAVVMLHSLHEDVSDDRIIDTIAIVRTLACAIDKNTLFQRHHANRDLPVYIQYNPHTFTKVIPRDPVADPLISSLSDNKACNKLSNNFGSSTNGYYLPCKCKTCEPRESYRWITILLEYFGNNVVCEINGFQELGRLLSLLIGQEEPRLDVVEVVLHFVSIMLEYLRDDVASSFLEPCFEILDFITNENGSIITGYIGPVSMILKHLRSILKVFLLPEVVEQMMTAGEKNMHDQLLATLPKEDQLLGTLPKTDQVQATFRNSEKFPKQAKNYFGRSSSEGSKDSVVTRGIKARQSQSSA